MSASPTLSCDNSQVTSRTQTPDIIRTNTLAVTPLAKSFFEPVVLKILHTHFSSFGPINQWVPLSGFARILVVYEDDGHAENAKINSDPITLLASEDRPELVLRVYRADPNPLRVHSDFSMLPPEYYLRPPVPEKNFLISPPGSPPVDWKPIKEDPPNSAPLADDLLEALRKLHIQQERRHRRKSSVEVLIEPEETGGVGVYIEDCDLVVDEDGYVVEQSEEEEVWVYGVTNAARTRWIPAPTAMPPKTSIPA